MYDGSTAIGWCQFGRINELPRIKHKRAYLNGLTETVNVILTRDPTEMLPSFAKEMKNISIRDVGYKSQIELLGLLQSIGQDPPVLDSKEILLNPQKVLGELCERIGISFQEAMLSWKAGARPEDGLWEKYWYKSVHHSTGFGKYAQKLEPFPEALTPLLEECKPYYEQLSTVAIKAL